ncbi:MAG: Ig-like domain-containing protein [Actinoallomurus sp.]
MRRLGLLGVLALSACGGGDLVLPNEGQPATLTVVSGDRQNGTIGQALPDSLVVRVTDRFGDPVPGTEVTWVADNGGGVDPATATTDGAGRAATMRTLGGQPGTYTTRASVIGLDGQPAIFVTTGLAAKLTIVTQPGSIATSGVPLDPQPVLQLGDPDGNPIAQSGVAVTVQIASGSGSLVGGTTATSDDAGKVAFADLVIRGPTGLRTLIFAADGFASAISAPVALGVGAPASIELAAGEAQTVTVGSAVPTAPAVLVKDASGNPVAGVPVNFVVTGGGGTVTGENQITGADGKATVGQWTLGNTVGQNTLEARISTAGVSGNPVVFHATGQAGALSPAKSTVVASPASIGASSGGTFSTITVTAADDFGNPLPGLAVTLAATGQGNTLVQPSGPTNAQGVATGRFSSTSPGDHAVSATVGTTAVTQTATVTVTAGPPVASASTAQVGAGTAGTATAVTINLRDAASNPVTGAAAKIAVNVGGANSGGGTVSETGNGGYLFTYTPLKVGTDQIRIRVDGADIPGSPFSSTISPGAANAAHTTAAVGDATLFQSATFVVTARDAQDNPVGHGGDAVKINVEQKGDLTVTDNGNGTYSAVFAPSAIGTFAVAITLNGTPIGGGPYSTTVTFF